MRTTYTTLIQRDNKWWLGWIEEGSGMNSQATTCEEHLQNLRTELAEDLETNRANALATILEQYEEVSLGV